MCHICRECITNANEGSVGFTEVEVIALALIVVSVFIILLCPVDGCAIAT